MLTLPNVATSDKYTDVCTLGPVATTQQIVFVVANAAALAQIAPLNQNGTLGDWGDEILLTPQSNTLQRAGGIRFRSAVAGVSAQVIAQLITPSDPVPGAGTPFTAKLSGSGGVSPGTAAVQVQKNGALVGTEPILDLIDTAGLEWTMADDAANTRVTVQAAVVPAAKIQNNAGSFSLADSVLTVMTLDAAEFNQRAMYAGTPGRLVAPVAGLYAFEGRIWFTGSAAGTERIARLRKNGAGALDDDRKPVWAGDWNTLEVFSVVAMAAGDYVELVGFQNTGAPLVILGGAGQTQLSGWRIG